MLIYLWIALGSAMGGVGRFWLSGAIDRHSAGTFPWGTLIVNVTGSFVIGFFATATGPDGRMVINPSFRQFFMIGICGGYTTFSAFSLQTLNLVRDGEWLYGSVNILGSVILCLVGVWLGHILAVTFNR